MGGDGGHVTQHVYEALRAMKNGKLDAAFLHCDGVRRVFAMLDGEGEETRIVGGAVRNALMGVPVADVVIAQSRVAGSSVRRGSSVVLIVG